MLIKFNVSYYFQTSLAAMYFLWLISMIGAVACQGKFPAITFPAKTMNSNVNLMDTFFFSCFATHYMLSMLVSRRKAHIP